MVRRLAAVVSLSLLGGCLGAPEDAWFCDGPGCEWSTGDWRRVSALASPPMPPPELTNRYATNPAAVALGRRFFNDARFSGPPINKDALGRISPLNAPDKAQGVSCASCHNLARGGADTQSVPGHVSVGTGLMDTNALPAVNSAYFKLPTWSGKFDSLWALSASVVEAPAIMNHTRLGVAWVIAESYRADYEAIFGPLPMAPGEKPGRFPAAGKPGTPEFDQMAPDDRNAITRVLVNFAKAIDAYVRRLVSRDAPLDLLVSEGPRSPRLSPAARRGVRLFVGKAACINCHDGPLLSDGKYHDVGVPQVGIGVPTVPECPEGSACDCKQGKNCLPFGLYAGLQRLDGSAWKRTSMWSDDPSDRSRAEFYRPEGKVDWPAPTTKRRWRTPSLRDVALTAPYMHDGAYRTLEEVVWHYDLGGRADPNDDGVEIKPLRLTEGERADLVEFLKALTGQVTCLPATEGCP